ncbi:uncharacterized protein LOC103510443 isoform X1 [Diaphorina citri]|uniref:Uncharacterized protein LOC103510443 isoform X1 n=1 Tax=Diaphorina citri TaxID=121845 RepID=A0A3Q0J0Z9_DIACI|nr:uncharacterized protein LOC103510443 isoform X1 [Diaphorina citri]
MRPHSTPVPVTSVENTGVKIITCSERLSDCQTCMAQLGVQQGQGQAPYSQPYIVDSLLQMDMKGVGSFYYENFAFPGMMPFKRAAGDKSGVPVYQPNAAAYQQLLQPFVPVSCEYQIHRPNNTASALTGVNLNKQHTHSPTLPLYVRHNVPTSTTSVQHTIPTLPNQHNPTLSNLPSSVASSVSFPTAAVMSSLPHNFQHFQHPFFTDLLAATQLSRFQAAQTITTPSVTSPTTVPAVLNNNNNNNNEDLLQMQQPFKKIRRDV